ncbi:MAG: TrmH family RNA methyltransferase, partial [Negativicoccus succinicivorans]|nr:TrmH family RNA methyltransferase [Negativicoccus succinicivorans]
DISYYESLEDFMEKMDGQLYLISKFAEKVYSEEDFSKEGKHYFMFGREDKGLPEELLAAHPEQCIRIPMRAEARSLNLSNAVAIVSYEALRQLDFPTLAQKGHLPEVKGDSHEYV